MDIPLASHLLAGCVGIMNSSSLSSDMATFSVLLEKNCKKWDWGGPKHKKLVALAAVRSTIEFKIEKESPNDCIVPHFPRPEKSYENRIFVYLQVQDEAWHYVLREHRTKEKPKSWRERNTCKGLLFTCCFFMRAPSAVFFSSQLFIDAVNAVLVKA